MKKKFWNRLSPAFWGVTAVLLAGVPAGAQTLGNQSLSGKYYFRQISLGTDGSGRLTDPRSILGAATFDGAGRFSFTGQQVVGSGAAASQTGAGAYTVDPAGFVTMDSLLRAGARLNARLGPEALLGSGTESTDNTFDLLVAVPAPATAPSLAGPYWMATLEFPGGVATSARNTIFSLNNLALGRLADITVNGHAADLSNGRPVTQAVTGSTFLLNADGTGSFNFGASSGALLSGSRTFYVSASGNLLLGGSTASGAHDIMIGVKAASGATAATWNADFWGAGLRFNTTLSLSAPDVAGYSGAVSARGAGKLTWTKRIKALGFGAFDFTGINSYALKGDGSGTSELAQVGIGAGGGSFLTSAIDGIDPTAFEISLGVQMTALSGTGVFLNPQRVLSAAGFAPAGNPISPGEFIALFGTGLARSTLVAPPPYPNTLNGVTVTINGKAAPIYFVSAAQINCLVPYSTTGPTATIVVQNGTNSNTVTVPVAGTSPAVYAMNQGGSGPGAILHTDYSLVSAAKPAVGGETVLIFLTGMGTVTPAVADGAPGGSNPVNNTTTGISQISVLVAGQPGKVIYSGLAPGFPGLYQINVTLPGALGGSGSLPLAILTPNAFHDQVDIQVQ